MWSALCGRDKLDKEIGSQIRSIAHLTKKGKKEKKPNNPKKRKEYKIIKTVKNWK
jgi:hypothetical protein